MKAPLNKEKELDRILEEAIVGENFVSYSKAGQERANKTKARILALLNSHIRELEQKLDKLYSETEKNYPPNTFNHAEQEWNNGFYRGQLKALELVSQQLFNKDGDKLVTLENKEQE